MVFPASGARSACRFVSRTRCEQKKSPPTLPSAGSPMALEAPLPGQPERVGIIHSLQIDLLVFQLRVQAIEERHADARAVKHIFAAVAAIDVRVVDVAGQL